jgi:tryptophan synthase alpha chain
MTLDNNRLVNLFARLRGEGRKTLVPFITAGYPDAETTEALLGDFAARGVKVCELGVPFSDPVADGPVIQASYTAALDRGVNVECVLETVRRFRASGHNDLAVVLMLSYSIVYRRGVEAFCQKAAEAGVDGLIVPDLPIDEAGQLETIASAAGLANVMLIAPTTPPQRAAQIAAHSRGFVYYISVAGITGARTELPPATAQAVAELRKHTDTPICVGFGISSPQQVQAVIAEADGAIVGSAIVKRITAAAEAGTDRDAMVKEIGDFVEGLLAPTRR